MDGHPFLVGDVPPRDRALGSSPRRVKFHLGDLLIQRQCRTVAACLHGDPVQCSIKGSGKVVERKPLTRWDGPSFSGRIADHISRSFGDKGSLGTVPTLCMNKWCRLSKTRVSDGTSLLCAGPAHLSLGVCH